MGRSGWGRTRRTRVYDITTNHIVKHYYLHLHGYESASAKSAIHSAMNGLDHFRGSMPGGRSVGPRIVLGAPVQTRPDELLLVGFVSQNLLCVADDIL